MQKNQEKIQLRTEVVESLNLQYKTDTFSTAMTVRDVVECAEKAMRENIDSIDYQLTGAIIDRYQIKMWTCEVHPFSEEERKALEQLIFIAQRLQMELTETSAVVNSRLQQLKDHIVQFGTKLRVSERYHKYLLYFKYINIKEAIIFELLSKCQIFYTITRERKRSGKEYYMDPLITCFENIKNKLRITHPFHQSVLPRKQLRFFQKKSTDRKMKNPLFDAVSSRKHDQVKELIAKGASLEEPGINERQQKREMYCSHRACQLGDLEMVKILHAYKVNWEVKDKEGMTPLHFAAQSGNLNLVKFLIEEAKATLQSKDIQERTPFYFACTQGDICIIKYLYEKGCDINNKSRLGRSALSKACYLGLVEVVTFLMGCPGIIMEVEDGKGRTALHNAVFGPKGGREGHKFGTNQKDSPECTQLLLENGFYVDYLDKQQNTPLHVSMSSDGIDSIRVLLAYGASLSKLNCYGETPLMTGAKFGHLQSVKALKEEYGSSLTVKDIFNKNLMLLCAKFRQDDGKNVNRVFYYAVDELLEMSVGGYPLEQIATQITSWPEQIDYTFNELLKEHERADVEFKYFCFKCKEKEIPISNLSLDHIKMLFDLIRSKEDKDYLQITEYFLRESSKTGVLKVTLSKIQDFVRWILQQNSVNLLEFVGKVEPLLKKYLFIEDSQEQFSFLQCLSLNFFMLIPSLKEKVITYCLLKLDIDWLNYIDPQFYYNIIHLLVKSKKVGSLIQVLKVLSGVKMDFISNQYVLSLINEEQMQTGALHQEKSGQQEEGKQSALSLVFKNMLMHKDREGFDPYHLALLVKDASASKLLEEKISHHSGFNKAEFEVKQYSLLQETDPSEVEKFNKGYQIEEQLEKFLFQIQHCPNIKTLTKYFSLFSQNKCSIDDFKSHWSSFESRKLNFIYEVSQTGLLSNLCQQKIVGIDVQYFYSQGATLISIMQISSISQDYIIDFLTSAKDHGTNEEFISAVRKQLVRMAYDPSITKIMHGSDNDLCVIKSVLKFSFLNFVDTARVDVEIRKQQNIRGLATLLKEYLGEYMSKDYQVSEWRIRPIPQSMLEYARKDSFVLPFLARVMLGVLPEERVKEVVMAGCRQARKNKKTSQPLIKSVQAH